MHESIFMLRLYYFHSQMVLFLCSRYFVSTIIYFNLWCLCGSLGTSIYIQKGFSNTQKSSKATTKSRIFSLHKSMFSSFKKGFSVAWVFTLNCLLNLNRKHEFHSSLLSSWKISHSKRLQSKIAGSLSFFLCFPFSSLSPSISGASYTFLFLSFFFFFLFFFLSLFLFLFIFFFFFYYIF